MDITLTNEEIRVLGSLIEKQYTTPDYYPLTLNALKNACNQKSSREPVVTYSEDVVMETIEKLKEKRLVSESHISRVTKFEQNFTHESKMVSKEAGIICVLLLRGPQTIGEIKGRTERIYAFDDLSEVIQTLNELKDWGYVAKLPRQPGRKESRWGHLFSSNPLIDEEAPEQESSLVTRDDSGKVEKLEQEIKDVRQELEDLKRSFESFKSQF